uniref:Uncharacterized protein n=1 Tax=Anguilla anguilla TaxID=7936 RepID=A0A0E9X346_ANGAN
MKEKLYSSNICPFKITERDLFVTLPAATLLGTVPIRAQNTELHLQYGYHMNIDPGLYSINICP